MSHSTHPVAASGPFPHGLPASLLEDVLDSFAHGEPLCCMARPGGGAAALLDELHARLGAGRRVVRCSLRGCRSGQDVVAALTAAMGARLAPPIPGTWREALASLLQQISADGPAALLVEDVSAWLLAWLGGVGAGKDSDRRMDLRVCFDLLARAATPQLTLVLTATPGLVMLLRDHRVEDVLTPFNELTLNLPNAVAHSEAAAVAVFASARAAKLGLQLSPELAEQAVALVGEAFPEHVAVLLDHLAKVADLAGTAVVTASVLDEMVTGRLLGAFEWPRWRAQEDSLYACVAPAFAPLIVELLRRAAAGGVAVEDAFRLAGVESAFGSMPVHLLRQYLEWMEQEGFLERHAARYRMPHSLFGRWLAAVYRAHSTERVAASAADADGGDSAV